MSKVEIGGRGERYYHWTVELMHGNRPAWLEPHLAVLVDRIQATRKNAGKLEISSLTITAPGAEPVRFTSE